MNRTLGKLIFECLKAAAGALGAAIVAWGVNALSDGAFIRKLSTAFGTRPLSLPAGFPAAIVCPGNAENTRQQGHIFRVASFNTSENDGRVSYFYAQYRISFKLNGTWLDSDLGSNSGVMDDCDGTKPTIDRLRQAGRVID